MGTSCGRESRRSSCPDDLRVDYRLTRTTSITRQEAPGKLAQREREDGSRRGESLRRLSGCAVRAAWRTRPQPASGDNVRIAVTRRRSAALSVAAVFGWPPTRAYADMNRLKSNDAIPRREFVPRDPCRRISFGGACRAGRRWDRVLLAAVSKGQEQSEISGVQRREAVGRTQRQCSRLKRPRYNPPRSFQEDCL